MTMTEQPAADRDAELTQLARRLERDADGWQRCGLWGLADQLRMAAEFADSWSGLFAEQDGEDA
jgi:hypothetical protein